MTELNDEIREFLIESNECISALDRDILLLEDNPDDRELISGVFRGIHTIKGTCGFFGFDILGSVTHQAETILSQVRERERPLDHEIVSLILETLDAVKILLDRIETTGSEGEDITGPLRLKLEEAAKRSSGPVKSEAKPTPVLEVETGVHSGPMSVQDLLSPSVPTPAEAPRLDAEVLRESKQLAAALEQDASPLRTEEREAAAEPGKEAFLSESTIRVDVALLNRLMNLVGELVLARNQLMQDISKHNPSLQQTSQRLNLITSELQEGVMKTRMQPIGMAWNKLPRVIRDLAAKCGKRIQIEMEGADTELDKTIIEAIRDPLTHIVRNSCDHGIETPEVRISKGKKPEGLLQLRAYHEGGVVNIEITDDGAGINPQRVKDKAVEKGLIRPEQAALMSERDAMYLIFLPGFSTAAQVTSVSGRGVGMDVVKTNIEKIGGSVDLLNRAEGGTSIRIKIPLTLAIIPGLVVALTCNAEAAKDSRWNKEERFIIPQANLLELVHLEAQQLKKRIEDVHGTPVFHHRGKLLPLVYLGRVLGRAQRAEVEDYANIIVLQSENRQLGLVVDRISDTQEIVVKPLGRQLKGLSCYVGATIMGDGKPALILDAAGLAKLAGLGAQERQISHGSDVVDDKSAVPRSQMMLLFRTQGFDRMAVPLALVDRLEEVNLSAIEQSIGKPVLHYRGGILPLVMLGSGQQSWTTEQRQSNSCVQIIVFTDGKRRIGLVVDQVLDIIDEPITVRRNTAALGALGSAVIGGKITDLLDLNWLVKSTGEDWLSADSNKSGPDRKLLLIDESFAGREILRDLLLAAGNEVSHFSSLSDAAAHFSHQPEIDGILIGTRLTHGAEEQLSESLRTECVRRRVPIVELLDNPKQLASASRFSSRVVRTNCEEITDALISLRESSQIELVA